MAAEAEQSPQVYHQISALEEAREVALMVLVQFSVRVLPVHDFKRASVHFELYIYKFPNTVLLFCLSFLVKML